MPLPVIGFDLQDLIDEGLIIVEEPSSADNPSAISETIAGLTVTIVVTPTQMGGELFDVDWGDGSALEVMSTAGASHTYAAPGAVDVTVSQHGMSDWEITKTITLV